MSNQKPTLTDAKTKATFTSTTTTWSDPTVTWSSASAVWGGYDPIQDLGPTLQFIGDESVQPTGQNSGMSIGLLLALTYP